MKEGRKAWFRYRTRYSLNPLLFWPCSWEGWLLIPVAYAAFVVGGLIGLGIGVALGAEGSFMAAGSTVAFFAVVALGITHSEQADAWPPQIRKFRDDP